MSLIGHLAELVTFDVTRLDGVWIDRSDNHAIAESVWNGNNALVLLAPDGWQWELNVSINNFGNPEDYLRIMGHAVLNADVQAHPFDEMTCKAVILVKGGGFVWGTGESDASLAFLTAREDVTVVR